MSDKKTLVLLVDDKPEFLDTLAERVELKGFATLRAKDGTEALELIKNNDFHLAVVDYKLPDMDGLELITKLKIEKPALETVLLTGYGDDKLRHATGALNSTYFEKQEMSGFWQYLASFSKLPTFLVVDDDEAFLQTISERMLLKGFEVLTAHSGAEALDMVAKHDVDFAVVDMKLPDMDGLVLITQLKAVKPKLQTMLLTAFGTQKIKMATEAINTGYFEKQDMQSFWGAVRRLQSRLERHMAAAGMATGGDLADAEKIESEGDE